MHCPKCGFQNSDDGLETCYHCGEILRPKNIAKESDGLSSIAITPSTESARKKKQILIMAGAILLVLCIAKLWIKKIQVVDSRPCIAAAEHYYSILEGKSQGRVSSSFSQEFLSKHENMWRDLLMGLGEKFGPVTEIKFMKSSIVPVEQIGCTRLSYEVHRGQFGTQENIIFRPGGTTPPLIIGYELIRIDTGQKIAAGVTVREVGFSVP